MAPRPAELAAALAARDFDLWPPGNVAADRLGWLDVAPEMRDEVKAIEEWAAGVRAELGPAVLFGMGGSSLAPEVMRHAFPGPLEVLDTTHPRTVAETIGRAADGGALGLIASKSGTTIEPNAMLAAWRARAADTTRLAAITDPGTALDTLATNDKFRAVFRNRPDIGGRYSALSLFGLVPAALLGVDLHELLAFDEHDLHPGVELGIHLASEHAAGRDKLTILCSATFTAFGLWVEQLVAESTGKRGTGIVPVAGETAGAPAVYGPDRTFVAVSVGRENVPGVEALEQADLPVLRQHLAHPTDLGELFFRWEVATAVVGSLLGIDPFDEPDVAAAKAATAEVLEQWPARLEAPASADELGAFLDATVTPGDYLAVLAYLPYGDAVDKALAAVQRNVRDRWGIAVTRGYGPRYLHSTGQLHKGGPASVVAVQLLAPIPAGDDLAVPGQPFSFGRLLAAQALGDYQTLRRRQRRVWRGDVGRDAAGALAAVAEQLR